MAVDEAKRARLQARLDKETSKSSLAEKVRRRLRSSRSRNATDDASFRPSIDQRAPDLASPLPPQVKAAKRTPAKMRTLVTATNDRNMFVSGHVPASKRPVSSSAAVAVDVVQPRHEPPQRPHRRFFAQRRDVRPRVPLGF